MATFSHPKMRGFTLIELIMVIVILGTLSAFALPKFADFSTQAEASSIEGAKGSVRSGSAIAHAACLADPSCAIDGASTVTLEGETIDMVESYPDRDSLATLASLDGYHTDILTVTVGSTGVHGIIVALADQDNSPCFTYRQAHPTAGAGSTEIPAAVSAVGTYNTGTDLCSGSF